MKKFVIIVIALLRWRFWIMFKHVKKNVQKTLFDQDQSFPGYVMDMLKKSMVVLSSKLSTI